MEHGEYLELAGIPPGTPLLDILVVLLEPLSVVDSGHRPPRLVLQPGVDLYVDQHIDASGTVSRLAIGVGSGPAELRRAAASRVHDILVEHTDWAVTWTADDPDLRICP